MSTPPKVPTMFNPLKFKEMGKLRDRYNTYGGKYVVTESVKLSELDPEEFEDMTSAEVTEKEFDWGVGTAICFFLGGGDVMYIPLSTESDLEVGDEVDLDSVEYLTLERPGSEPCYKVDGQKVSKRKGRK